MKTLKIIAIISGCLTFAQSVYLIMFDGSIGIISSADGPTVTYYAPHFNPIIQYGFLAISAFITITATIIIIKKKKNS